MLKPIKNKTQYKASLARIYALMQKDLKEGSRQADELIILSLLVKEYESEHYSVPKPMPGI